MNLFCVNEKSYKAWWPIIKLAYKIGFSPYNITCVKINKNSILDVSKRDDYKFVIMDRNLEFEKYILSFLYIKENEKQNYLIKSFVTGADVSLGDWEQYIKLYTIPRSFAVNTMRHGAPLEMDF